MPELTRRSTILAAGASAAAVASAGGFVATGWYRDGVAAGGGALRTTFGSVAVLVAGRESPGALHGGGSAHRAWSDRIGALIEVRNDSPRPVLVSSGQFRLRLDGDGPTVSYYAAEPPTARLDPNSRMRLRVSYLSPPEPGTLALEYTEAGAAPASAVLPLAHAGGSHR